MDTDKHGCRAGSPNPACQFGTALRVPLLLFALPAVILAFSPSSHPALLLDRHAVATGEIWRLWTGHFVHFSASHLLWNLAGLLAAGAWLERLRPGRLLRHALIAPPLLGLAILLGEPRLQAYGGLSGLATGVVVLLALEQLRSAPAARWLWAGVLALVALKGAGDFLRLGPGFAHYDGLEVHTSTTAHAAGAIVALLQAACSRPGRFAPENDTAGIRDGFPAARFRRYP